MLRLFLIPSLAYLDDGYLGLYFHPFILIMAKEGAASNCSATAVITK